MVILSLNVVKSRKHHFALLVKKSDVRNLSTPSFQTVRGRKGVSESGSVSGRKGVEDDEPVTEDKPVSPDTTTPSTDATAKNSAAKTKTEKEAAGDVKSLLIEGTSSHTSVTMCFISSN